MMTEIEKINWDRQVKTGELSFGALKAELAATKRDVCKARESEAYWKAKAEASQRSASIYANSAASFSLGADVQKASLAEQLAARKVDAEIIATLNKEIEYWKEKHREGREATAAYLRATSNLEQSYREMMAEVSRLKKRVNTLIRKAKQ